MAADRLLANSGFPLRVGVVASVAVGTVEEVAVKLLSTLGGGSDRGSVVVCWGGGGREEGGEGDTVLTGCGLGGVVCGEDVMRLLSM